jgi:hypothetical protein
MINIEVEWKQLGSTISTFGAKKPKNMADRQSNPSSSSSSDSHGSLVNQLCRLVDTIRQGNNDGHRRENENHATETTSAAITRLFPSVNGRRNTTNDTNPITPRFVPSRANVPKQTKRKKPYSKKSEASSTPVMKDVILLPNPRMKTVPRGRKREELYARGFVATAFSITNEMTNAQMHQQFSTMFSEKLKGTRTFTIVRAVGNRIVEINISQEITGKVLKHICGQGPVYLRCVRATDTEFAWVDADDESDTDDGETIGIESESDELPTSFLATPENSAAAHMPTTIRSECTDSTPNILRNNCTPSLPDSAIQGQVGTVACPSCNMRFPVSQIEQHADACCEGRSSEASLYGTWVLNPTIDTIEVPDEDPFVDEIANQQERPVLTTKELIETLITNVASSSNRIAVRRKFLWDDFVTARKKPWFLPNGGFKIDFIGEEAIDGGGPRREFFTGIK